MDANFFNAAQGQATRWDGHEEDDDEPMKLDGECLLHEGM
jgi:hypothetical protein